MKTQYVYIGVVSAFLLFYTSCSKESTSEVQPLPTEQEIKPITVRQLQFPSANYIMVGAHRGGYKGIAPENSIAAIKNALNLEVDIIEIDVRLTKDNKLVVIHDNSLDRTTNGSGGVWEHTLTEIKALYLKDENDNLTDERVPTLEEVMLLVGNKAIVFIDKAENAIDEVIQVLTKTGSLEQALFMDFITVENVRSKYRDVLEKSFFVPGVHISNDDLVTYYSGFETQFKPSPSAFAFWYKTENSGVFSWLNKAKKNNIPVWVNTTEDKQCAGHSDQVSLSNPNNGWGWVIDHGATIVFSDYPTQLINYLISTNKR